MPKQRGGRGAGAIQRRIRYGEIIRRAEEKALGPVLKVRFAPDGTNG